MKAKIPFFITEVFGIERYSGNQLATFFGSAMISDSVKQKIARELNFSETTFVDTSANDVNGYNVRIFTPGKEIDFAGHPSLGTAFIVNEYLEKLKKNRILLNFRRCRIPVINDGKFWWMKQDAPIFGSQPDICRMARILSLAPDDINDKYPVQVVSTGLPFTIVNLKNLQSLKKARINIVEYNRFISDCEGKCIAVFTEEPYSDDQDIAVRVFADYLGVAEDPATGSAAGCIASYLLKYGIYDKGHIELTIGQGFEINRPSEIKIKATKKYSEFDINVGGKVKKISSGEWFI